MQITDEKEVQKITEGSNIDDGHFEVYSQGLTGVEVVRYDCRDDRVVHEVTVLHFEEHVDITEFSMLSRGGGFGKLKSSDRVYFDTLEETNAYLNTVRRKYSHVLEY